MVTKILTFKNIQLASKFFDKRLGRRYFRVVNISELTKDLLGETLVFVIDCTGAFPAGILIDVFDTCFCIKSPETGQILRIDKQRCHGFTSMYQLMHDLCDNDLQQNPQNYVVNFTPATE